MNYILKGNVIYSKSPQELSITEGGYLICDGGTVRGVFTEIPSRFEFFPVKDYGQSLIIPGLCDLHTHAPQYPYRGLGASLELLEWLETYTYPEETKYADLEYADRAYFDFVTALARSATTRACIFATPHKPATIRLMEKLEGIGIVSYVGLVSMDRNCPEILRFATANDAYNTTRTWLEHTLINTELFKNTKPILTPRFIPTCSDTLMGYLKELQVEYELPLQSHLSENPNEIKWVRELAPDASSYADAYARFGLFGCDVPTIMAHCVWCSDEEKELLHKNGVYVAHCPQSNMNIASGIAPVREYMTLGINVGLGTDVAGGSDLSIFRAMSDAIVSSKMYWRLVDNGAKPLSMSEAFYLATIGGGGFFGKVGSFEDGYEFDAVVLDDSSLPTVYPLATAERFERIVNLGDDNCVGDKYVKGILI